MHLTPRLSIPKLLLAPQELIGREEIVANTVNLRLDCSIQLNYFCITLFRHSGKSHGSGIDPDIPFWVL